MTLNGRITWRRTRWWWSQGGSDTPLDRLLDAQEATVSLGVRELCCRLGLAGGSFARSVQNLQQAAGLRLSEESLRQLVESEGQAVLRAGREEQLELDWSAARCQTATPAGLPVSRLYVSADGVLVPTTTQAEKDHRRATVQQWRKNTPRRKRGKLRRLQAVKAGADQRYKQVYVTVFYDQDQTHRLVAVTRQDHRGLRKLLQQTAVQTRLAGAQEQVGLVDGAVCLRGHLEDLDLTALGLDFYHFSEHVHAAARATFGLDNPAGEDWVHPMLTAVVEQGYEAFFQKLLDWRSGLRGAKRQAADALIGYVSARQEMIHYRDFKQRGWHIGTGPMEAMCKATTRRLKGPGMRWDLDHAEEMMALEALYQSNLWNRYWNRSLGRN